MKKYIIVKITATGDLYYEKLFTGNVVWNSDINKAKVFEGSFNARQARTGKGAARWKIHDAPIKKGIN